MAVIRERISAGGRKSYHVQIRIKGFPPQTKTFPSKTMAKDWSSMVETELKSGRYMPRMEAQRHTVADLIERYRTEILIPLKKPHMVRDQTKHLDWWSEKLGRYALSELNSSLIAQCRNQLLQEPNAAGKIRRPATVVRYMAVFSHALNVTVHEWGWLEASPMKGVKKPKVENERQRCLTKEECERVLTAATLSENRFLYLIVLLAISTGMRYSEIMNLRWKDVHIETGHETGLLLIEKTKNGERRALPLAGSAFDAMQVLNARIRSEHADKLPANQLLFPSDTVPNKPVEIHKAWDTCRKRADLTDFRFHDLRHTAGSYLAMSGASTREIAEVLGHKTLHMVKRYSHLTQGHLVKVIVNMNKRIKPESGT